MSEKRVFGLTRDAFSDLIISIGIDNGLPVLFYVKSMGFFDKHEGNPPSLTDGDKERARRLIREALPELFSMRQNRNDIEARANDYALSIVRAICHSVRIAEQTDVVSVDRLMLALDGVDGAMFNSEPLQTAIITGDFGAIYEFATAPGKKRARSEIRH